MERKCKIISRITRIMLLVQFLETAVMMRFMPDRLPMHFDVAGNVDRYGSKYELFILVGVSVLSVALFEILSRASAKKNEGTEDERDRSRLQTNRYAYALSGLLLTLIMTGVGIAMAVSAIGNSNEVEEDLFMKLFMIVMNVGLGLLLVLLGNIMPKSRINGNFGVRTGWSTYNDETWTRSNRIGGRVSVVCGFICMAIGAFAEYKTATFLILGIILIMSVALIIVSYSVYSDVREKEEMNRPRD